MTAAATDELVLAAAAHLTSRDRQLVRAVGEHRVLTTCQLAALGFGSVITARHRLAVLVQIGVLRRFRPHRETAQRRGITCSARSAPSCSAPRTPMRRGGWQRCAPTGSLHWNAPSGWPTSSA
jgi:Replication-relaxation